MKTGLTHFSKNSADLSFQDISKILLSDLLVCPRYLEKNFHENQFGQFSGTVNTNLNHLSVDVMKTR